MDETVKKFRDEVTSLQQKGVQLWAIAAAMGISPESLRLKRLGSATQEDIQKLEEAKSKLSQEIIKVS